MRHNQNSHANRANAAARSRQRRLLGCLRACPPPRRFKETNKYLEIAGMNVNSSAAYRADRPPEEEDNTSKFR